MSFREFDISINKNDKEIKSKGTDMAEVLNLIGKDWMLISSGNEEKFNMMTASWGGLGVLWNKNVTFSFIRPQRYTIDFIESNDYYALSFYDKKYRESLNYCGKFSGRDVDKMKESKLTPVFDSNTVYFAEASLVLICKKIYEQQMDPECFIDKGLETNYPQKDYHKVFIGEIEKVLVNEN